MGGGRKEKQTFEMAWAIDVCARCGSPLILGEPAVRVRHKGLTQTLCAECAAQPRATLARTPLPAVELAPSMQGDEGLLAA
jgi:RNase P subunit RPR2